MKYFISDKEETHFAHTKVPVANIENFNFSDAEEIVINPGVIEDQDDPKAFIKKLKDKSGDNCVFEVGFINIYQLFVDAAFHKIDLGIAHKVCANIKKPYNVMAAKNTLSECGMKISKVFFEDQMKIIKIECKNA